jgi:hypothetical protein
MTQDFPEGATVADVAGIAQGQYHTSRVSARLFLGRQKVEDQ